MNISPSDEQKVGQSAPGGPVTGKNGGIGGTKQNVEEPERTTAAENKNADSIPNAAAGLLARHPRVSVSQHANVPPDNVDNKDDDDDEDDDDEEEEQQPNYDHLPPLKRPRKKIYKSTLRKRNREKKRRDHFNDGLEQLAELVFEVDPSIASGRDDHIIVHDGKSTTITNRGDLMESAVFVMRRLLREHSEQKATIAKLSGALAEATAKSDFLAARANLLPPGGGFGGPHGLVPLQGGHSASTMNTAVPPGGMLQRHGGTNGMNLPMNNNVGSSHSSIYLGTNNAGMNAASLLGANLHNSAGAHRHHQPGIGNQFFSAAALVHGRMLPQHVGSPAANFLQGGSQHQLSTIAGQSLNPYLFPSQRNGNPASFADFAPSSVDINIENPSPRLASSFEEQQRQHLIVVGPLAGDMAQQYEIDEKGAMAAAARMNKRGSAPKQTKMS